MNFTSKVALMGVALSLGACSALDTDKVDYRSASKAKAPSLVIPPDLTQLSKETRYVVADGGVSASSFQKVQSPQTEVAAAAVGDVRIERDGNQRWLVIKRPADKLWEPVKEFWQDNGFVLAMDQKDLGIMETDWAENRAKIPQDFIRSTLGKVLDFAYSTAERDKFRTRLERNPNGDTEIFITHRGVAEVYTQERSSETVWQPRPADPELEAEFLRRLMVKLGVSPEQSKTLIAANSPKPSSSVTTFNDQPALQLEDGFDRAWRKVGLALDRTGFTVEDRDRKLGIYYVRYVSSTSQNSEPGFFSKLFGGSNKSEASNKFQIAVRSDKDISHVIVLDTNGQAETSEVAQRIVKVLADDIK